MRERGWKMMIMIYVQLVGERIWTFISTNKMQEFNLFATKDY